MNVTGSTKQLAVVGVLAAAVMYFGPVQWALGQTDSLNQQVTDAKEKTANIEDQVRAAKKAKANEAQYRSDLDVYRTAFPAETKQADLIDLISDTASSSGVAWKANASSDPLAKNADGSSSASSSDAADGQTSAIESTGLRAVTLAIDVAGNPDQLSAFVSALRSSPRMLVVDDIAITKQTGDAVSSARMTVRAFTWSEGATPSGDTK